MTLFNRPSWAKTSASPANTDEAPDNIFSHSNRSYREIVAEQERKKQAKSEKEKNKLKVKEENKSAAKRQSRNNVHTTASSPKRRRISLPDEDGEDVTPRKLPQEIVGEDSITYDEELYQDSGDEIRSPVRRSPRKSRYDARYSPDKAQQTFDAQVVELGDSDGDDGGGVKLPDVVQSKAVEVFDDESDDEFAELARRARQQRQKETAGHSRLPSVVGHSTSPSREKFDVNHEHSATPLPDPTIELFISSRIENTNPMIVFRKLSQNLADVRRVWCERQRFSDRKAAEIYFVHRMRRVYDVTTCRSLGIDVDSLGNLTVKGAEGKENVDKVHLEAVTNEIFRQVKSERTSGNQGGDNVLDANAGAEDEQSLPAQQQADTLIRLIMKARGRDNFKLKVKHNTSFSKIMAAYARTQQIGDAFSIRLEFDGEQLAPDDEVQSTEISDMDCIDVHLIPKG